MLYTKKAFYSFRYFFAFVKRKLFSSFLQFYFLLAVLQKFTNNTQSETSSMAFSNFHSCLKFSFSRFPGFSVRVLFSLHVERSEYEKRRNMNNCSRFLKGLLWKLLRTEAIVNEANLVNVVSVLVSSCSWLFFIKFSADLI